MSGKTISQDAHTVFISINCRGHQLNLLSFIVCRQLLRSAMSSINLWTLVTLTLCLWNVGTGCTWMETQKGSRSMFQVFNNKTISMLQRMVSYTHRHKRYKLYTHVQQHRFHHPFHGKWAKKCLEILTDPLQLFCGFRVEGSRGTARQDSPGTDCQISLQSNTTKPSI